MASDWLGRSYSGTNCDCCKGPDHPYMVTDDVWAIANKRPKAKLHGHSKGFLCLNCLEDKLGRDLTIDDFTPALINKGCFGFDAIEWLLTKYE